MNCIDESQCPAIYQCVSGRCEFVSIFQFDSDSLLALLLIPILASMSQRAAVSAMWITYPIFVDILSYEPADV